MSKLAFGGVVLVNALHFTKESVGELIAGLAFMIGFLAFGSILVKRATKKKDMTTMTYIYLAGTVVAIIGIVYNLIVMRRENHEAKLK